MTSNKFVLIRDSKGSTLKQQLGMHVTEEPPTPQGKAPWVLPASDDAGRSHPSASPTTEKKTSGDTPTQAVSLALAGQRRSLRARGKQGMTPAIPPPIEENTFGRSRKYYLTPGNGSVSVTREALGGTPGMVCYATNTDVTFIASSIRLRKVTIWPAAGGDCYLYWNATSAEGVFAKDDFKVAPLPTGITATGPTVYVPPKGSTQSMWQAVNTNSGDVLFSLVWSTAGCVIEVDLDWRSPAGLVAHQATCSAMTAGAFAFPALDGNSSHSLNPVGLPTAH